MRRQLLSWRNRLLADARFRRWAHRFLPTRWIARRQAREVFDVIAGFTYSQILLACVRLNLFDRMANAPVTAHELASPDSLDEAGWADLLHAAESLDMVSHAGGGAYVPGRLGIVIASDSSLQAMIRHHIHLYRDLVDPVALLRGEVTEASLNDYWPYAGRDQISGDAASRYTELMAASQPMVAEQVIDAFDFTRFTTLMDVGGGNGAFLRAVAPAAPKLNLMLFDLPPVADLARAAMADANLTDRTTIASGDFRRDALPEGADLISLVRIAHDHDDDTVLILLEKIRKALRPAGTLVIAEPMAGTPGARRMGDAYFRVYLRAMGTGRPRTPAELTALLHRSGFGSVTQHRTAIPMLAQIVSAQPDN